ncbi:MAG: DUF309 domain-containing protein [Mycobacterium sp.]
MTTRDRDELGRPRNARPRDRLGRLQPRGGPGIEGIPDDLELPPEETLDYAQRLLDEGRAFGAHEVLEAAWKNGPAEERLLWQGLAQLAVGVTHIQRGNITGAVSLLRRGSEHIVRDARAAPYGIDVPGLREFASTLIGDLNAGVEITPDRLHPRLVVPGSRR